MLNLVLEATELFNEETEEFFSVEEVCLELEHSLISVSKWESKFEKPFLGVGEKSPEEVLGYVEAMILTENYPKDVLNRVTQTHVAKIHEYIEAKHSATTFGEMPERKGRGEIITSELVYYWMVAYSIPFECETWHLNRLFSLIRICNIKNEKPKKMSRSEIAQRNRQLNEKRKAELNTTG